MVLLRVDVIAEGAELDVAEVRNGDGRGLACPAAIEPIAMAPVTTAPFATLVPRLDLFQTMFGHETCLLFLHTPTGLAVGFGLEDALHQA